MWAVFDQGQRLAAIARGVAGDYLVVLGSTAGPDANREVADRTLDLIGFDGSPVGQVIDRPIGASGVAPIFPPSSIDLPGDPSLDPAACAVAHGLEVPTVSAFPAPVEPAPPDIVADAWFACRGVVGESIRNGSGSSDEYVEDRLVIFDCVGEHGFYPALLQPVNDMAGLADAYDSCDDSSPGRLALVDCLANAGVVVVVGERTTTGPFPADRSAAAWHDCRDTFVRWSVANDTEAADRLPPLDCAADRGWIIAVVGGEERARPDVGAVIDACRSST